MSEVITAARPYARAAFELAEARGRLEKWSQMLGLAVTVATDPGMDGLLDNPTIARNRIADLLIGICGETLDAEGGGLIRLLAENGRLTLLPHIHVLFEQMRAEAEGCVDAEVVSAFPLEEAQKEAISAALKRRTGRDVRLDCKADESLLGGAVIRMGDLVIDGSIRGRLDRIAVTLNR